MANNKISLAMADNYFENTLSKEKWFSYDECLREVALKTAEVDILTELRLPFIVVKDAEAELLIRPSYETMAVFEWALVLLQVENDLLNMILTEASGVSLESVTGLGTVHYDLSKRDRRDGVRVRLLRNSKAGAFIKAARGNMTIIR